MLIILVVIECLSWVFTIFLAKNIVIKYLMIQSLFFIVIIVGLLWRKPLMMLGIIMKMGLPPFHLWFFNLSQFLKKYIFLFFTSLHKVVPLFFLLKRLHFNMLILGIFIIISSVILIMETGRLYFVIIFSAISHSGWIIILSFLSYSLLFFYWVLYSTLILLFFLRLRRRVLINRDREQNSFLRIFWLIICGLPPFTMFWLKVNILFYFIIKRLFLRLLIIIVPVLTLVVYFRIFHLSILISKIISKSRLFIPVSLIVGVF